ncbi:hypothetical protein [Edaphobacter albus]|uniref:hypothetical protein n=1 Tax=Edaphobacter sp. 4G125 TaxID=2763071 RepID=UPI001644DA13|nr:hypothetical protein [Edaphobacter sp. 4G125]QNI37509.1 hypothetical protein H7846_04185 [Edaphobacter sp. 4G125]
MRTLVGIAREMMPLADETSVGTLASSGLIEMLLEAEYVQASVGASRSGVHSDVTGYYQRKGIRG